MSSQGSDRLSARKACATYERVAQTVPSTNSSLSMLVKEASLTACANVDIRMFCWNLVKPSRKIELMLRLRRKEVQHLNALDRLVFVVVTVAFLQARAAESMK